MKGLYLERVLEVTVGSWSWGSDWGQQCNQINSTHFKIEGWFFQTWLESISCWHVCLHSTVYQSPIRALGEFCLVPESASCDPPDNTRLVYRKEAECTASFMYFTYKGGVLTHSCSGKRVCPQGQRPIHMILFTRLHKPIFCKVHLFTSDASISTSNA